MPLSPRFIAAALFLTGLSIPCWGASPEVQQAVSRAATYLEKSAASNFSSTFDPGRESLLAYVVFKATQSPDRPAVQNGVALVQKKCAGEKYRGSGKSEHIYEAAVDAMLLGDVGGERFLPELQKICDYIVGTQLANGSWDYTNRPTPGDISVCQYAFLGLWTGARFGAKIPKETWEKSIQWHLQSALPNGGFNYVPGTTEGESRGGPTLTMTAAGGSSLLIGLMHLHPERYASLTERRFTPQPEKTGSPLENVSVVEAKPNSTTGTDSRNPAEQIEAAIAKSTSFFTARYQPKADIGDHAYYYYTLERFAALGNVDTFGNHQWFQECSERLLKAQAKDGSWDLSHYDAQGDRSIATSLITLFLLRSTGKILNRAEPNFGDGLLAGGRGLPDDLASAEFNGRSMQEKKKPAGPLDELLASLAKTGDIDISDVQDQIVEQVQLGDRKELVKQKDLLVKLIKSKDANVRLTAAWALGRADDMRLAMHLINALDDEDIGVVIEARNSLCWLSRRPRGFGFPEDPVGELPPDAPAEVRKDAIRTWHNQVMSAWGAWYLENRPYDDRGDQFEALLRRRLQELKLQQLSSK